MCTCLIVSVQVAAPVAEFRAGLHNGLGHFGTVRELLHGHGPVETVVLGLNKIGVPVRLGLFKIRQHVVPAPAVDAGVTPSVVHEPVTPGVHHAGHRTSAAQHLAAGPRAHAARAQARVPLRLRQILPVKFGAHGRGGERRHRRGGRFLRAGLQQAHRPTGHFAESGRDHGAGHATADHDEVQFLRVRRARGEPFVLGPATRVGHRTLRPDHQIHERHEERQRARVAARPGQERRVGPRALFATVRHDAILFPVFVRISVDGRFLFYFFVSETENKSEKIRVEK